MRLNPGDLQFVWCVNRDLVRILVESRSNGGIWRIVEGRVLHEACIKGLLVLKNARKVALVLVAGQRVGGTLVAQRNGAFFGTFLPNTH